MTEINENTEEIVKVKTPQDYLEGEITPEIEALLKDLTISHVPSRMNGALDVGTSKTRAVNFSLATNEVQADNIVTLPNEYSLLSEEELKEALSFKFEKPNFMKKFLVKLTNTTNMLNPYFDKQVLISKGLVSEKLLKTDSYSVSNTAKYDQKDEYILNAYSILISQMISKVMLFISKGDLESASKSLNAEINVSFMLPDEEGREKGADDLLKALEGTVEFELPLLGGLKGKFHLKNGTNQFLKRYGEAESVIYYFMVTTNNPDYINAYKNHAVAVCDMGEGSLENIFFKERELIEGASSTDREINGLTMINRVVRNIKEDPEKSRFIKPSVKNIKPIMTKNEDLVLITPSAEYDFSENLTKVKQALAGEIVNKFKNSLEETTVLAVEDLFLVILAGRTMTPNKKSKSLGVYIADLMEKQIGIPKEIVQVTHPDANLLGAALKLMLDMKRAQKK